MKKLTIILALLMVLSIGFSAFAETVEFEDFTVDIPEEFVCQKGKDESERIYKSAGGSRIIVRQISGSKSLENNLSKVMDQFAGSSVKKELVKSEKAELNGIAFTSLLFPDSKTDSRTAVFIAGHNGYSLRLESDNLLKSGDLAAWESALESIVITAEAAEPELDTSLYTTLQNGNYGDEVKALQKRLIELKFLSEGAADGSYGNMTETAVKKFQKAAELDATGIADPETQALLFSEDAPEAKLSISCSSIVIGSSATTSWYVDGNEFTIRNSETRTLYTAWGTYKFDAFGNYEKID